MINQDKSSDELDHLVDEWLKHFKADNLAILNEAGKPKHPGFFTVSQAASLFMSIQAEALTELTAVEVSKGLNDYIQLMINDIANGKIDVVHPVTHLPRSTYTNMIENGMLVDIDFPYFDPGWLIDIKDIERWYRKHGIRIDLSRAEAESRLSNHASNNRIKDTQSTEREVTNQKVESDIGYQIAEIKRASLIKKLEPSWPTIQNDLSEASRNGLSDARAKKNGYWITEKVIAWAKTNQKWKDQNQIKEPYPRSTDIGWINHEKSEN